MAKQHNIIDIFSLTDPQQDSLNKMHNGCILCGGVGSGKSRVALAYYGMHYHNDKSPLNIIIITTAKKRDTKDWEMEAIPLLAKNFDILTVDSWNNIKKYVDTENTFFIFDEQRVVGYGAWTKAFLKITKKNPWILLSATPGDCWIDYLPVFIANGFYKNKSEFSNMHVIYSRYTKYPSIDRYVGVKRLMKCRDAILVCMGDTRDTVRHDHEVICDYDILAYKTLMKERKDITDGSPIKNITELIYKLRKIVNSDESRISAVQDIVKQYSRVIIFYNYDYELDILKNIKYPKGTKVAEWNGHKHEDCPNYMDWVYLVQYSAGCEGWNCITTNCMIFYSQTYSYKVFEQAKGRIDRMNTAYKDLHYYHFISSSKIDLAIRSSLKKKKNFNESAFVKWNNGSQKKHTTI